MGSPITFSGFNSIDFNMILNAVMQQERQPITRLESKKSTLETQNSAFATLAGKLSTLEAAVDKLKESDSLAFLKATSSDTAVGVSTTSGTVTGTYDIVVTELARAQVTASSTTFGDLTDVVATGGTLTLTGPDGPIDITLTGSTTLQGLANAINAEEDSPATASVVQTAPGTYKLVLTGRETGADNSFTIDTSGLTGSTLAFDPNVQEAIDAEFEVNGLAVTSSSNTVTDVIAGVTLSLTKKDPATTVTVKVERDYEQAKSLINKFISAYNDIHTFAKDQNTAAIAGKASIGRDPLLRSLRDGLRSAMMAQYTGGSIERLASIGIGFDSTGKMVLDEDVFEDAVASSPADVQMLISGDSGNGGAFGELSALLDEYTKAGGLVSSMRGRIDDQIKATNKRLDDLEAQLAVRRAALQREYIAADLAMTRLKSQSASLSSVGGGYKLF